MTDSQSEVRIERTFWPNGQLQSETPYVGDKICGVIRHWHMNGVLQSETPIFGSKKHGTAREWDSHGQLVGECDYENGSGLRRAWFGGGQRESELSIKDGVAHGRLRSWDEGGEFLVEQFFISGRQVSKKKYLEACPKDPSLPWYDQSDSQIPLMDRVQEAPLESNITSEANYPEARDALAWLQESTKTSLRTLGELPSAETSIDLVKEFLAEGAVRVLAIDIYTDDDVQNTGEVLIELPTKPAALRERALAFCNEQNQLLGFSPVKDTGQRFVHVGLD